MQVKDYVKPELLVVAVVLYFIGAWLKQSETVKDKYIPLINGAFSVRAVKIRCDAPLVLTAVAAALGIGDNAARLRASLCIQSVLFGGAPERFTDFDRKACIGTLIDELRSQRLEARMA